MDEKRQRLRDFVASQGMEAILLRSVASFAWATDGAASYVNSAATQGEASLLVTPDNHYLITSNIEAPRLEQEERLATQGWEFRVTPWHKEADLVSELAGDLRLAADMPVPGAVDLSSSLSRLRAQLTPEEGARFRDLGRLCATAMAEAIRGVEPGQTEFEMAAQLAEATEKRGVQPIVNLIATDERIYRYRHPLPTDKRLERYGMLVLCGRRDGLVCSITRLIHFGALPDALRDKMVATAAVDAALIGATRPGRSLREIFRSGMEAYADAGYPAEWQLHHQGGPAGYQPREYLATPDSPEMVSVGQVYAWNPSITGCKSEDTILIGESANEVLTAVPDWPAVTATVDGAVMERPAILQIL